MWGGFIARARTSSMLYSSTVMKPCSGDVRPGRDVYLFVFWVCCLLSRVTRTIDRLSKPCPCRLMADRSRRSDRKAFVVRHLLALVLLWVCVVVDAVSVNVLAAPDFWSFTKSGILEQSDFCGLGDPGVPERALSRRAMPRRPMLVQVRARRPRFAMVQALSFRVRAMCS